MINKKVLFFILILTFMVCGTISAQTQVVRDKRAEVRNCSSICINVHKEIAANESEKSAPVQAGKVRATLINNTRFDIKVPASGTDWLYYEIMSDLNTVKKRYDRHVFYFRTVKARSSINFDVYLTDLEDIYALRLRYHYASEDEYSDELIHYVSWLH